MSVTPAEVDRIIAGLSGAQMRAFMAMPTDCEFNPLKFARQVSTIAVLRSKRLIRTADDVLNPWAPNVITRPRGIAVRNRIMETGK